MSFGAVPDALRVLQCDGVLMGLKLGSEGARLWALLWSISFEEFDSALSDTDDSAVVTEYSDADGGGLNGAYFKTGDRE